MQRLTAQVVAQCDEARRERDAARLACCSPQLQDASTLLVTAVAAARALRVVLDAGGGGVDTEVLAIDVAAERVGEVRVAVEKCIGQLAWLSEERVRVEATPVRPAPELLVPGAALPPRPAAGGGQ